jgi:hypothetical protein
MKCSVCSHAQCHNIDLALLAGNATLDALQERFGLSRSAIQRHKRHLLDKVDRAEARIEKNLRLTYLFQLNAYQEAAAATVVAAQAQGNDRLTIQAANSGTRIVNAMARLQASLGRETTYRLLAAPEWVQSDCLLPDDPHLLTGPRRALAQGLFSSCPDADPDDLVDLNDLEEYLAYALNPQAAASPAEVRQLELPDFLTAPAPASRTQTASSPRDKSSIPPKRRRDKSGIQAECQRDKSGIKAVQTRPRLKNILQDQIDRLNDKRSATSTAKARKFDLPPAVMALLDESQAPVPETANLYPQPTFAAPTAVLALPGESPTPTLETENRELKTVFATAPPANAANVGRESEAHPAFSENDAPSAFLEIEAHPAVSATAPPQDPPDEPQEILDETLAAELAAYLKDFPPYAGQARDPEPDPCPSNPGKTDPKPGESSPPNQPPKTHTSGPSRPPNFGNPGLFQQIKGTFC